MGCSRGVGNPPFAFLRSIASDLELLIFILTALQQLCNQIESSQSFDLVRWLDLCLGCRDNRPVSHHQIKKEIYHRYSASLFDTIGLTFKVRFNKLNRTNIFREVGRADKMFSSGWRGQGLFLSPLGNLKWMWFLLPHKKDDIGGKKGRSELWKTEGVVRQWPADGQQFRLSRTGGLKPLNLFACISRCMFSSLTAQTPALINVRSLHAC